MATRGRRMRLSTMRSRVAGMGERECRRKRVMTALREARDRLKHVYMDIMSADAQIVPSEGPTEREKASCTIRFARVLEYLAPGSDVTE